MFQSGTPYIERQKSIPLTSHPNMSSQPKAYQPCKATIFLAAARLTAKQNRGFSGYTLARAHIMFVFLKV